MANPVVPTIPADPLFSRLVRRPGGIAQFARDLNVSTQRVTNWRKRGIPAGVLPQVASTLKMTIDEYLTQAGMGSGLPAREALTPDEKQMLDAYRSALPRWKATLKHMVNVRPEQQDEMAEALLILISKIAAAPVSDARVAESYGRVPSKKHS